MRRVRAVAVEQVEVEQEGWDWRDKLSMFRRRIRHLRPIREKGEQNIELSDDEEQFVEDVSEHAEGDNRVQIDNDDF